MKRENRGRDWGLWGWASWHVSSFEEHQDLGRPGPTHAQNTAIVTSRHTALV